MRAFWDADEGEADKAAQQVLASGASVDEIRARLKAGRPYAKQKTGRIELPSRDHGLALDNIVEVPADYDPARAWPLRVSLHGGVGREAPGPGDPPARPLTNRIPERAARSCCTRAPGRSRSGGTPVRWTTSRASSRA